MSFVSPACTAASHAKDAEAHAYSAAHSNHVRSARALVGATIVARVDIFH